MPIRLRLVPSMLAAVCSLGGAAAPLIAADGQSAETRVERSEQGIVVQPRYTTDGVANVWPDEWEAGYQQRVTATLERFRGATASNTTGEHEKWNYPRSIGAWLVGDGQEAITALQAEDIDRNDHAWLGGIDLYWCFTLKGQALKYFYFEHDLAPEYRERMRAAFATWTETDPRPSLEYVLNLTSDDADVVALAEDMLRQMFRTPDQVREMAAAAASEGHQNKKRFAEYMLSIVEEMPAEAPTTVDGWVAWWGQITAGDWMVFEEYERRTNPNPHPAYGIGTGPVGGAWNPAVRGMRADARNTDNLRGMREVAIYLFAEEVENDLVRRLYKERIKRTAMSFWNVGNGEWDSEGYLAHTISAYQNLYAFARDPEVRHYAKAILDFLYTAGAVKYWRGCWGGPVKRDYGNAGPWSATAEMMWLSYGGAPMALPKKPALDNIFTITSGYRPPAALVAFAQRHFEQREFFNSHPTYSNWLPGADAKPEFYETMYYGDTYQIGTLARGSGGDVNGFKILTYDSEQGADYVIATSGSPRRLVTGTAGGDRVAQYRNLVIFLNSRGDQPVHLQIPADATLETTDGVTFIQLEQTWMAWLPLNLDEVGERQGGKGNKRARLWSGTGKGGAAGTAGFALEVGDAASHGDYEAFKTAILANTSVDLSDTGDALLTASDGRTLGLTIGNQRLPIVTRDGEQHDWANHHGLYQPADGGPAPLSLGWHERELSVSAGGYTFQASLAEDGTYTWSETLPE